MRSPVRQESGFNSQNLPKQRMNIADERDDAASRQMIEMLETIDDDLGTFHI